MAIFHAEPNLPTAPRQSVLGARWRMAEPAPILPPDLPPAIAQVLATRGVVREAEVRAFLEADLAALPDPFLLSDMDRAVDALLDALAGGRRIRIFGDYDADGITATALLVRALGSLGGQVDWYLPHRIDDGYGLNRQALDDAFADGVALGITVDNGISALEELAYAEGLGLRMIVTDHHEPGPDLPPAVAVLNPKRADSPYPSRELAGVGVAFTLLRALCQRKGVPPAAPMRFLDLVAIGTVVDVAPLIGENRLLVRHGLPTITPASKKVGLAALLRAIGIPERASCTDVGFQIGPRLNAAGRVAHADVALRLLLTTDPTEAADLAQQLCAQNAQRQEEELRTLEQALAMVEARDLDREKVLLLDSPDWHPGVIGIVASRIVERFYRPCALVAVQDGVGKGSARARAPFHLWEALERCAHLLTRFGGHRVAAGFEVETAQIAALREALIAIGDEVLSADDLLPMVEIDAWVELPEITTAFARQVEALAPFGVGNPTPVFAATDVQVVQSVRRGSDGAHLGLTLRAAPGARPLSGIWFRHGDCIDRLPAGARIDVAFTAGLNCWQGITSAQIVVKDVMV